MKKEKMKIMKMKKKLALAGISALITPIALMSPAHALTISTTPCVLNIPAKNELVREAGAYYVNSKTFTFHEADLTCPDVANPFKTTNISYLEARGGNYASWTLWPENTNINYYYGAASGNYQSESVLGAEYGVKRIDFYVSLGSFVNVGKTQQNFVRTPGPDAILDNDDDVLYPMTLSNGIVNKFRTSVKVKTKKLGTNLQLAVTVDRNLYKSDLNSDWSPKYANKSDKAKVYRDGKLIKTVAVGISGKVTFTVPDKSGNNRYLVVLPSTNDNHEGSAAFVK
jgi:hypothetical protein